MTLGQYSLQNADYIQRISVGGGGGGGLLMGHPTYE